MLKHLSFNGNKTAYLIQGQEFELNFHFTRCLFVLVYYNNGKYPDGRFHFNKCWNKISFRSTKGAFESITNVYHPEIKFITFCYGIKIHSVVLKINFFNTIEPSISIINRSFTKAPKVKITDQKVVLHPIEFSKMDQNPKLEFLDVELNNKSELNYKNIKLMNYESN